MKNTLFRTEKLGEIFLFAIWLFLLFQLSDVSASYFLDELELDSYKKYEYLFCFGLFGLAAIRTIPFFLVSVPEVTSLITVNFLTGKLSEYPPGTHFRFPWEQARDSNYINLRIISQSFEKGEDYPSHNGVMVHVKWSFQYRGMAGFIKKYIAVDKSVIDKGLHDIGSSFLGQIIANLSAETTRKNIKLIERCMRGHYEYTIPLDFTEEASQVVDFVVEKPTEEEQKLNHEARALEILKKYDEAISAERKKEEGGVSAHAFEEKYGIELILVAISDVDYEPTYQQALAAREVANKLKETADRLQGQNSGEGAMTDKEAMQTALIINKNATQSTQVNVQEIKGVGGEAVVNFLLALANAAGGSTKK